MREYLPEALVGLLAIGVIAVLIILGVHDCRQQQRCEAGGGTVERYNFRTVLIPIDCGSGCTMLVPTEVSDWRCVGARPEL